MEKIAILSSTRPLRERVQDIGRMVETLSPQKCTELAEQYDVIIIGSRASDEFFERIKGALPRRLLDKFRLYPRSFFNRFKRIGSTGAEVDDRDEGWKEILRANGIVFVLKTHMMAYNYKYEDVYFQWNLLTHFIRDKRVTVIGEEAPLKPGEE
jgi:hypothetical protein